MATTPNRKLDCHSQFFGYEFSFNLLISKTYDCGGLALKPRPLLDVHLFLFELYDPRGNKYQ